MVLEIPSDVLEGIRLPENRVQDELRREFAVFLVQQGLLSVMKARRLAGMDRVEFNDLLARRQISHHGAEEDLQAELEDIRTWPGANDTTRAP